jgi:hypothetical protein
LIGTLVLPGGLATTAFVFLFAGAGTGSGGTCDAITTIGPHGAKVVNASNDCAGSGGGVNYLALVLFGGLLVVLPILTSIYLSRRAKTEVLA